MARSIVRNEDFKSTSNAHQVSGLLYYGAGFPNGRVTSPNLGAVYIDNESGQLWVCAIANSTSITSWKPFNSNQSITNASFATDVQEGDFVGVFGPAIWTNASANMSQSKNGMATAGAVNAAFVAGGTPATSRSELFNGTSWAQSGNIGSAIFDLGGAGSIAAGIIAGGGVSTTQLFDGSTWANSGNGSLVRTGPGVAGTANATLQTGGFLGTALARTEFFNGATWSTVVNLNISRQYPACSGAQNSAFVMGGITSGSGVTDTSELFNGSAWSMGAVASEAKRSVAGSGSVNASLIAGGTTGGVTFLTRSELFNGSAWTISGGLVFGKQSIDAAGTQTAIVPGGYPSSSSTQMHNQSTYRRLNYSNMANAANIGMAYNLSATSLTGTVLMGDVPSTHVPTNMFFGISKFNTDQTFVKTSSVTGTVSSISVVSTGSVRLNLSATVTDGFWSGMGILIDNTDIYPVTGGTAGAPIVRWNTSHSASTSLTYSAVNLNKFTNFTIQSISSSNGGLWANVNLTNVGNISSTTFCRWCKVGSVLHIPYNVTSSAVGSAINFGTYSVLSVTNSGGLMTLSVTSTNYARQKFVSFEEAPGVTTAIIHQQLTVSPITLSSDDVMLGFKNRMHIPNRAVYWDDFSNGTT